MYDVQQRYKTSLRLRSGKNVLMSIIIIIIIIIIISGVILNPLGTAATTGLLYQSQMIDDGDCGAVGGMKIGRGN
jgi:cytochrome b subunit of formate dehydrogenase